MQSSRPGLQVPQGQIFMALASWTLILALIAALTIFGITLKLGQNNKLIINEYRYLRKINQNLVYYQSCQAVRHTAYLNKSVPDPYSGDWKCLVAIGWKAGTGNRQFVRRSGMQMPSTLRLYWMMKFISELWQCQAMKTFLSQNGQLVIYSPWNFQPV